MTISSSLNAGVSGLASNASKLATIADNIANSSTFGYKRSVADFHSMVIDNGKGIIDNGKGSYTAGGVRVTTQRLIDESGPLVTTSNPTDLAVRGRGLLPVAQGTSIDSNGNGTFGLQFATTGSFRPDADGFLTTPSDLVLLGWPAAPNGTIPNFPRDSIGGLEPVRVASLYASNPTTEIQLSLNLPATGTMANATGEAETLSIEYYNTLGVAETLSVSFVPTVPATGASNTWTMLVEDSSSGGAIVGNYTLQFDDAPGLGGRLLSVTDAAGTPYNATDGTIAVAAGGGTINMNIGLLGQPGGLSQLSDSFALVSVSKDGSPVGNLTSVDVDANGYVRAFYDTGVTRVIYQIPLADVSNMNGLETQDYQSYTITPESGEFYLWDASDGPTGDVVSFAREGSATDVAGELTQLIQTQRAYSSNAKVIQTVDEMLQETTNIKR